MAASVIAVFFDYSVSKSGYAVFFLDFVGFGDLFINKLDFCILLQLIWIITKVGVGRSMVGVGGLEPPTSASRTLRATNCATLRGPYLDRF